MKSESLLNIPASLDAQFRDALETTSTQSPRALQKATDALAYEMVAQLRAVTRARGGAYAAAFSHALAASPLAAYMRRDFTQCLPTELAWDIFEYLSLDDLGALSQVNHQCRAWAQERLTPLLHMAMRWKRLPVEKTDLRFDDGRRDGRHWGRDVLRPNPKNSDQYLLAHEGGIEVSEVDGGKLVSKAFHKGERKRLDRIPCAWLAEGDAYTYVQHREDVGAVLHLVEQRTSAAQTMALGLKSVGQLAWSPSHPHKLAVADSQRDVLFDVNALGEGQQMADCMQVLPDSNVAGGRGELIWCPSRPWLLSSREDQRILVTDCSGTVPKTLHALSLFHGHRGNAAWHATRAIFAVVTENDIQVVNLEGENPTSLTIRPYDLIKFRHSISFSTMYLAWEPHGLDLLAVSCSDELVIAQVQASSYERVAVSSGYDVNNRGLHWSPTGEVEIRYDDGKLVRVGPVKRPVCSSKRGPVPFSPPL